MPAPVDGADGMRENQNQLVIKMLCRNARGTVMKTGKREGLQARLSGELAGDLVPGALDAAAHAVLLAVGGGVGRRRVGSSRAGHLVDGVAGAAAADVVDGGGVLAQALLLGELLVEAEHGALLLAVDVAGAAAARGEVGVGGGRRELHEGGGPRGVAAVGDIGGVDAGGIASAAAARVDKVGGGDGWVRLGDVVGDHFGMEVWGSGGGGSSRWV